MSTDTRVIRMILARWFRKKHTDEVVIGCADEIIKAFGENSNPSRPTAPIPLDWAILTGQPITEGDLAAEQLRKAATTAFEKAFNFGALPWSSNTVWEKFEKFVVKVYGQCPTVFDDYVKWREGSGKYKAMSNLKIRISPQAFMDTGMPEFEASKMYTTQNRPKARMVR